MGFRVVERPIKTGWRFSVALDEPGRRLVFVARCKYYVDACRVAESLSAAGHGRESIAGEVDRRGIAP